MDVIIVGGGVGGLAASIWLARAGRSVVVLERSRQCGGRARSTESHGALLNLGPHALYDKGGATDLLADLGVSWAGRKPDDDTWGLLDGRLVRLPLSAWLTVTCDWLTFAEKVDLTRRQLSLARLGARPGERSVLDWLADASPRVSAFFQSIMRVVTFSQALDQLDLAAAARQGMRALSGVYYLDGGWQTLIDGLEARAREAGVRIESGAFVHRLTATSAETEEQTWTASQVVAAVPPAAARAMGVPLPDLVPARVSALDVVLDALPERHPGAVFGLDAPTYLSNYSRAANLGDGVVVSLARYLRPDEPGDTAGLQDMMDTCWPGWRGRLRGQRAMPEIVACHAIDALSHPRVSGRVEGIWLVGDHVVNDQMLVDSVLSSARDATRGMLAAR